MNEKMVEALFKSKARGRSWAEQAAPVLASISREIKEVEAKKAEEEGPIKVILEGIRETYGPRLAALDEVNKTIREELLKKYEGTEAVETPEAVVSFPLRWGFVVTDIKKVETRYLEVSKTAVNAEIKAGIRKLKGIEIDQTRGVQVKVKGGNGE